MKRKKNTVKTFEIDPNFLTDINVVTNYHRAKDPSNPTHDELIQIIKNGPFSMTAIGHTDHPEFTRLREQLGEEGYIKIERAWWNGDRVLKPFKLNNKMFNKGDQFACASAIKYVICPKY